ncbi:MAG TPA: hypothetical protein VMY43_00145 [Methanothrix sp.]|nr:hypothetical protein [Methanothrix sp.]
MDFYIIIPLIVILLMGVVVLAIQTISSIWGLLGIIIGPLIGAFVGVLLGFKINDNRRKQLEEERRLFFGNLLMHEAKKSIELIGGTVNLIPVDAWNSVVNSGDIALFKEKAIELSNIYFEIQNYNYEAKRVRDAIEEARLHPTSTDDSHASRLKERFDNLTKPILLENLNEIARWLSPLAGEISASTKVEGKLSNKSSNGREK